MNRRALLHLGLIALASPFAGCGGGSLPPADHSDLPPEVRADEEAREAMTAKNAAEREKRMQKKH